MRRIEGRCQAAHDSWRIVVDILIAAPDGPGFRVEAAKALIDTGALRTALAARLVKRLDLAIRGKIPVLNAGGDIQMHHRHNFLLGFPLAQENGPPVPYMLGTVVLGMAWPDHPDFDALLGMDVLSQFNLVIRADKTFTLDLP